MKHLIAIVMLGGVFLAGPVVAQEVDPGRKVAGQCRTCHGIEGKAAIPIAPNIGGESAAYLERQLKAFRSGDREHEMMTVVARSLSDQEIADVASWYAAQQAKPLTPAGFDPDAAPEPCAGCHGPDGIAVIEDAPHLAGENTVYLQTQLKAFRSGARQHAVMTEISQSLTDDEIVLLSNWFAQIGIEIDAPE